VKLNLWKPLMEHRKQYHLEEQIYAVHVRDQGQNQGQEKLLVELVEGQDFKP
jgi:hypothetical protein